MDMSKTTLTDRKLKALKPAAPGKRVELYDAVLPGLAVRVTDTGKKSFVLIGRFCGSAQSSRRMLGQYPIMQLAQARAKAREWIELQQSGKDPKPTRRKQIAVVSMISASHTSAPSRISRSPLTEEAKAAVPTTRNVWDAISGRLPQGRAAGLAAAGWWRSHASFTESRAGRCSCCTSTLRAAPRIRNGKRGAQPPAMTVC
jgi:hypothetical protein